MTKLTPFADEATSIAIDKLTIENTKESSRYTAASISPAIRSGWSTRWRSRRLLTGGAGADLGYSSSPAASPLDKPKMVRNPFS